MIKTLFEKNKRISAEWDLEKNKGYDPRTISCRATFIAWWKCSKGHEWKAQVVSRVVRDSYCPYCRGRFAVSGENDIATLYPELVKELHPTKNEGIDITKIKESSGKKIWWRCDKGHEWKAVVYSRTKGGYGCPVCSGQKVVSGINDFSTLYPDIAKEVFLDKNPYLDITKISGKNSKVIIWLCPQGHEYKTSIAKRTGRGDGCPFCSGRYPIKGMTDVKTLHPEVLKYWDYDKNGLPDDYTAKSSKVVSWKCDMYHTWIKKVCDQVNYNNCPYCDGFRLIIGKNDVATLYPELVENWDYTKNNELPTKIKANVNDKYWWVCEKGHSYEASIYNRTKGKKCPYCAGKLPINGENDLATVHPEIAAEWFYEKNRRRPDEYLPKSNQRVYWKCEKGHIWKALISERTRGTGCPICNRESIN